MVHTCNENGTTVLYLQNCVCPRKFAEAWERYNGEAVDCEVGESESFWTITFKVQYNELGLKFLEAFAYGYLFSSIT